MPDSRPKSTDVDIYNQLLDNYKMFSTKGKVYKNAYDRQKAEEKFKRELKRRLDLRNRIYKVQTDAYGNGNKKLIFFRFLFVSENGTVF